MREHGANMITVCKYNIYYQRLLTFILFFTINAFINVYKPVDELVRETAKL